MSRRNMKGLLALDTLGIPGIITVEDVVERSGPDGIYILTYQGVSLTTGEPWYARNPTVLGPFDEFIRSETSFVNWASDQLGIDPDEFVTDYMDLDA